MIIVPVSQEHIIHTPDTLPFKLLSDIRGSIAHAKMLGKTGIIRKKEASLLVKGLNSILHRIKNEKDFEKYLDLVIRKNLGTLKEAEKAFKNTKYQYLIKKEVVLYSNNNCIMN